MKSKMKWARHVARMEDKKHSYRVWWGNLKKRDWKKA
jgi:hypothetical protein